jgi:hypothetical protein
MRFMSAIVGAAFVALVLTIPVSAQETVTFYSRFAQGNDSRSAFDFESRVQGPRRGSWDIAYGNLRAGEDFDWFESSGAFGNRSVIKDLGLLNWTDNFVVPVIEPFAKLKPGERRTITIDVSGADGAAGANGSPGAAGANGRRGADAGSGQPQNDTAEMTPARTPSPAGNLPPGRPKRDGKPKIDSIFVKAIAGHLYAIHVVDDTQDYYVLFRVEALTRGQSCTISWRFAPAPVAETVQKQK